MNHSITIDRVLFVALAGIWLFAATERFAADLPALAVWMVVVIGVVVVE